MKSKVHYSIKVIGLVQGVFFRASTQETARKLGINGWVRNEPDGSVQIEAEAPEVVIEDFLQWCNVGPENAEVTTVNFETKPLEGFSDFTIKR